MLCGLNGLSHRIIEIEMIQPFALARIATHVVLHRVSIRTLDELLFEELGAGWGSVAVAAEANRNAS